MNNKKTKYYIIAVLICAVIWGGFMFLRGQKKEKEQMAHAEKTYDKATEFAKKSAGAGLTQMGMALRKYYANNNKYPERLDDLFPKYIPSKTFIEELDWYYEPKEDNFTVSKRVTKGNQTKVASIDSSLRIRTGKSIMLATVEKPKPATLSSSKSVEFRDYKDFLERIKKREMGISLIKKPEFVIETDPRILSVSDAEIGNVLSHDASRRYLVWKNDDGTIGLGNVQHPDNRSLSIYSQGSWFSVKSARSETRQPASLESMTAKIERGINSLAADHSGSSLVWKDKNGTIGFGNIIYPDDKNFSVYSQGKWLDVEKPVAKKQSSHETGIIKKQKNSDTLAENHSGNALVWKDKDGVIGFGNVEYPATDKFSIYSQGDWLDYKTEPSQNKKVIASNKQYEGKKRIDEIASAHSNQYMIWKGRDGAIGFSDIIYPEENNMSYVFINGTWEKRIN